VAEAGDYSERTKNAYVLMSVVAIYMILKVCDDGTLIQ
jgi:hypothetical protein